MTSPQRASEIAATIVDPVLSKSANIVFGKCGNCLNRVRCSSRMVDIRHLFRLIGENEFETAVPGKPAKAAARIFKSRCAKCDQLKICIDLWASANGCRDTVQAVYDKLRELGKKDEDEIAGHIEYYLRSLNLTGVKLLSKAATLWVKCDRDRAYTTTALKYMERRK